MDPHRLGILVAAAWLYLGGNALNERTLLAFFRTLAQPDAPPAPDHRRAAPPGPAPTDR